MTSGDMGMEEDDQEEEKVMAVAEPTVPGLGNTVELDENATLADMRVKVDAALGQA